MPRPPRIPPRHHEATSLLPEMVAAVQRTPGQPPLPHSAEKASSPTKTLCVRRTLPR